MIQVPEDGWGADTLDTPGSLLSGGAAALTGRPFVVPDSDGADQVDDPVDAAHSTRERASAVFRRQRSVSAFNRGLDELAAGIAEAPDWSDGLERFDRKVEELRQRHAGDLQDTGDREAFALHADEIAAVQRIGLNRALVERQVSDALTQLDDQLTYYADKAAGADHNVFRQLALDSGVRAIDELREAGYLTTNGADERKAAFLERTKVAAAREPEGQAEPQDSSDASPGDQLAMGRERRFGSPLPPHRDEEILEGAAGRGSGSPSRSPGTKPAEPTTKQPAPAYPDHPPSPGQLQSFKRMLRTDGEDSLHKSRDTFLKRIQEHENDLANYQSTGGFTSHTEKELRNFKRQINAIDIILSRKR